MENSLPEPIGNLQAEKDRLTQEIANLQEEIGIQRNAGTLSPSDKERLQLELALLYTRFQMLSLPL